MARSGCIGGNVAAAGRRIVVRGTDIRLILEDDAGSSSGRGTNPHRGRRRATPWLGPSAAMRTWTATTTAAAHPEAVLNVLTDPDAAARWAPVAFDVDDLDGERLLPGSRARVSGRLAGRRVGFDVDVHEADTTGIALSASGPVRLDVAYQLSPATCGGSEVRASVSVRPSRGLAGRLLAEATSALLSAGALEAALSRVAREAVVAY